ncbi:helix-turn-helix domain-containing protein [uncultured Sphingomonas sp.]|uniref:helix-turn-helix domain-containing protein n=1 Tax=uncultured Sphingomonas sp. TaxID=158754 RepID=UPI00258977D2|nr:helix-turn-helix domain-containing protein [uncultured Sphingomonas sp.]
MGTFEHTFWVPPEKGETDRIMHATRKALDAARGLRRRARMGEIALTASERLLTSLTAAAVRVMQEILDLARLNSGRVYPTYDRIAEKTHLGRRTVSRAISVLESLGLIQKQRRFTMVPADDDAKRYRQTSNAYRPTLPQIVSRYLPKFLRATPAPADATFRAEEDARMTEEMLASTSCEQRVDYLFENASPMAEAFRRMGALVDSRECQIGSEPLPQII